MRTIKPLDPKYLMYFTADAPEAGGAPSDTAVQPNTASAHAQESSDVDLAAEVEKWKALSKKNESRAKANAEKARRFDEIEEQSKTELQKALDAKTAAEKRADQLEAQALRLKIGAAKNVDPELLVGTTEEELEAAANRLLAWKGQASKEPASSTSADAGARGDQVSGAKQLTREDLKSMTPEQINQARRDGQLNQLMGIS